jgi:hypothetical protein
VPFTLLLCLFFIPFIYLSSFLIFSLSFLHSS